MSLPEKEEHSALDAIEHELYNPKAVRGQGQLHKVHANKRFDLPTTWGDDSPVLIKAEEKEGISFGAKLLLLSTFVLLASLSFTAWRVFSLRNIVSPEKIEMSAEITPYIEGGETNPLVVTLRNTNASALEEGAITLFYKQGNGSQDEQEKIQEKRSLGTIKQNEYKRQDFSVILYGSEGEARDLVVKLEYKVRGSNALFTKVVAAHVVLRTPPISVVIEAPNKISVGQNTDVIFTVKNNSATTSAPSVLMATIPSSFSLQRSSPESVPRTTSWKVASLKSGESTSVKLTGVFSGKEEEVATFGVKVGSRGESEGSVGIVYSSQSSDTVLHTSPLTVEVKLSLQNTDTQSLHYGDMNTALEVTYNNSSNQVLEDVSITLSLAGEAVVYTSIDPGSSGYYDSVQKTITWNKASHPDLAVLAPGAKGVFQITMPVVSKSDHSPSLQASVKGVALTKAREEVTASASKTWGVRGSATLVGFTQYKNSPFENSGPIPPQPNRETTYTVHLVMTADNAIASGKASFVLPAYVTWRNVVREGSSVTYEERTRTVTWNIPKVQEGVKVFTDIGLSVKPSQSHVGTSPSITSKIVFEAEEEVSKAVVKSVLSALTTSVNNESWVENPALVVSGR